MNKSFHLEYEFIGGRRAFKLSSVFAFAQTLDKAMDDPQINQASIIFWTEKEKS